MEPPPRDDLKRIIRERQSKTGESYTAARSYVMRERTVLLGHTDEGPVAVEPLRLDAAVLKVNQQSARVRSLGETGQNDVPFSGHWPDRTGAPRDALYREALDLEGR